MTNGCIMEKVLKVPFKELTVICVICKDCASSIHLRLDKLAGAPLVCPTCRKQLRRADVDNALKAFANSLTFLQQVDEPDFQIVLPMPDGKVT